MNTFTQDVQGVITPAEAEAKIAEQRAAHYTAEPKNLDEQAINLVGTDIYEKPIKGYTEKQWGRPCTELPAFIIKRLPVRLTFDNNYFNALYQGIPNEGYTALVANLLQGIEVRLDTDYLADKAALNALADKVVYTAPIDAYFDYKLGAFAVPLRRFETETLDIPQLRGNAVINYTDARNPTPASLSTSTLSLAPPSRSTRRSSAASTLPVEKPGDEPYYPSTMPERRPVPGAVTKA